MTTIEISGVNFSDESSANVMAATVEYVGQQWVRPSGVWWCDDRRYAGVVAVESSDGWIYLADVYQSVETNELIYKPVKYADMPIVEVKW